MRHALFPTLPRCQHFLERLLETHHFLQFGLNFANPLGMLTLALELVARVCACKGGFVFSVPFARLMVMVMRFVAPITDKTHLGILGDVLLEGNSWQPYTSGFLPLLAVDGLPFAAIFPLVGEVVANKGINRRLLISVEVSAPAVGTEPGAGPSELGGLSSS